MKITYVSNYLTIHLRSLADEFYKLLGADFCFVETVSAQTEDNAKTFNRGYAYYQAGRMSSEDIPWRLKAYQSVESADACKDVITNSDVVIIGNTSDKWIIERLRRGKLTFRAHERWYRHELPWYKLPKATLGAWLHHGRFKSLYMLCASAYTSADVHKVNCFKDKVYRWGYFPETKKYTSIDSLLSAKTPASLLWVGRDIECKRPKDAIDLAEMLRDSGYSFTLDMIGIDDTNTELNRMLSDKKLQSHVRFLGTMPPERTREYMEQSEIFLFTTDRNEGWGAVLNEAMNSGCAVVAGHAIGSVPYLIEDNKSGLVYESGNVSELYEKVKKLLNNKSKQYTVGKAAYHTITDRWNAANAAQRLLKLSEAILSGDKYPDIFSDGICSKAPIISDDWYL